MPHKQLGYREESGFTLVELAIVMVIIGLILGGILSGRDLIINAKIRAQISQIQQYDAAVNTFRSTYDGLPGDITRAEMFALCTAPCNGNGDGQYTDSMMNAGGGSTLFDNELSFFWAMLSSATIIDASFTGDIMPTAVIGEDYPYNKMDKGGVIALTRSTVNYWGVGVIGVATAYGPGLAPIEAFGVDTKLDDSKPLTGVITAQADGGGIVAGAAPSATTTPGMPACVFDPDGMFNNGDEEYNNSYDGNGCPIEIRMSG